MNPLRLRAIDQLDLSVVAAHVQDAVAKTGEIGYDTKRRRFAILVNRFMWEDVQDDKSKGAKPDTSAPYRRVRAALHFDSVLRAQTSGLKLSNKEAVASLLTLNFQVTNEPAGTITMTFSGGGTIKLEVECLDVWLTDLSAPWASRKRPEHESDTAVSED